MRDLPLDRRRRCRCCRRPTTRTRAFDETTLEPPLGSGPYEIGDFKPGTFVTYKRRADYWAKDLPVNRGRFNFDEIRYEYYRDRTVELESLKAGAFDLREEFTVARLGDRLRHPAGEGRPAGARSRCPTSARPARRASSSTRAATKFKDPRVRKALDLAFDFEWTNKNLFYGLYTRTDELLRELAT